MGRSALATEKEKSPGFVPASAIEEMTRFEAPVLLIVRAVGELTEPVVWPLKFTLAGDNPTTCDVASIAAVKQKNIKSNASCTGRLEVIMSPTRTRTRGDRDGNLRCRGEGRNNIVAGISPVSSTHMGH